MTKRAQFTDVAADRLLFLARDRGFAGPEVTAWPLDAPALTRLSYHLGDLIIEVAHVTGYMGEDYVESRCRRKDGQHNDWISLGRNTTHTGYQLRRALDIQAHAISFYLDERHRS